MTSLYHAFQRLDVLIWFDVRTEFNASLNSLNPVSETYEFGVGVT